MANAFSTQGATPHLPQGSTPASQGGGTPFERALNGGTPQMPPPIPLMPPISPTMPDIKSHSIQHPDGTVVTQQFHKPETGMLGEKPTAPKTPAAPKAPAMPQMPDIHVLNGIHHIPFKAADGTMKFINANGEIM